MHFHVLFFLMIHTQKKILHPGNPASKKLLKKKKDTKNKNKFLVSKTMTEKKSVECLSESKEKKSRRKMGNYKKELEAKC